MRWLLALFLLACVSPAFASSCASYDSAYSSAEAELEVFQASAWAQYSPSLVASTVACTGANEVCGAFTITSTKAVISPNYSSWVCPTGFVPPSSDAAGAACKAQPAQYFQSTSPSEAVCSGGCGYAFVNGQSALAVTQTGSGAQVQTTQMYPTGATCDSSGSITNASDTSVPKTPTIYPAPQTPAPKLCGGGSCYDPSSGNYCATSGGAQICVSASDASSSGGCASSGGTTVCAGDPAPIPSKTAVANPQTQITASDTYSGTDTDASGNKASSSTTVNVYNDAGTTSSSGATSSDATSGSGSSSDPASSSSAGKGDDGSVSGGGDCATPPICSGDAVECAVVTQTWNTRCEAKVVADALDTSKLPASPEDGNTQAATVTTQELGGDPDSTGLDDSGWGFSNKCPLSPLSFEMEGQTIGVDLTKLCDYFGWLGILVLVGAYIAAAKMIMD